MADTVEKVYLIYELERREGGVEQREQRSICTQNDTAVVATGIVGLENAAASQQYTDATSEATSAALLHPELLFCKFPDPHM